MKQSSTKGWKWLVPEKVRESDWLQEERSHTTIGWGCIVRYCISNNWYLWSSVCFFAFLMTFPPRLCASFIWPACYGCGYVSLYYVTTTWCHMTHLLFRTSPYYAYFCAAAHVVFIFVVYLALVSLLSSVLIIAFNTYVSHPVPVMAQCTITLSGWLFSFVIKLQLLQTTHSKAAIELLPWQIESSFTRPNQE